MAAFVPGFENDLFVSYASGEDERWIQAFEDELRDEVSRRLGLGISIWQDTVKLRASENWQSSIQQGIARSAAFVAVVSPLYQNSQWCARERLEFRRMVGTDQFAMSGRFFKAVKLPWPQNSHRLFLQEIQDVEFFKDIEDGPREFLPGSREFRRAVRKLADGVEPLLRKMRRGNQRVHVAWPVEECLTTWQQLSDELHSQGFDVQPTGPRDTSFAERLLIEDIDQAVLSIHLVGSVYDEFSERVALLAADLEREMMFWISSGADQTTDQRQRALIDAIRRGIRPDKPGAEWPRGWSVVADAGVRRLIDAVITKLAHRPLAADIPVDDASPHNLQGLAGVTDDGAVPLPAADQRFETGAIEPASREKRSVESPIAERVVGERPPRRAKREPNLLEQRAAGLARQVIAAGQADGLLRLVDRLGFATSVVVGALAGAVSGLVIRFASALVATVASMSILLICAVIAMSAEPLVQWEEEADEQPNLPTRKEVAAELSLPDDPWAGL